MFHNSRKTIGVFLERSASEFQNRLCQGIITGAKEIGYNVAVFSDYGNYGQNHRYFIGDQTLWELPPYEELDGVVLALDTMEEIVSREHVIKNIRERCHCPIVSIRELLVGANNLLVDNSSCMASEGQEVMTIRQRMYETENIGQNREMQFHFMSIHMSECHTIDEVGQKIGRYIYNIEGFKDYCMCLCEGWLEKKEFKGFTDKMEMPIAIRNRENISPTRERFDRRELIPKCMSSEEPQMWFLASLHFQDLCFGYEALQFIDAETTGRLYMNWNIIIGNLLQDIMTYQKMQKLVVKLEEMYDRDALTGMYNRRGFENRGNPMFEQAKEEGKQIFLAIIDMDGMKQINDNYGHIEGDYALKKVREAIHHACPDAVIQARTGGDEFEIIAEDIAEDEGVHYLEELVAYLDAFNESGGKEYDIHASYGYACRVPSQQDTMEIFIKESDEIMYRNKVINKINRGEALR